MHVDREFPFPPSANVYLFVVAKEDITSMHQFLDVPFLNKKAKSKLYVPHHMGGYDRFVNNMNLVESSGLKIEPEKPARAFAYENIVIDMITRKEQLRHAHGWDKIVYEMDKFYMILLESPTNSVSEVL